MLRDWLSGLRDRRLLRSYVKDGLKMGRDVRVIGKPDFGSEPYLIEIGNHVTVSSNVTFITHDGATWVFRHLPPYLEMQRFGRIVIGDNCFIGANAIIMPGVSIGSNSVVGAGAVVTRSVPADSVVAGVPARRVCSYEEYVERMIPRCRSYPPDVTADRKKLKDVLISTMPHPTAEEGQSAARSRSVGDA